MILEKKCKTKWKSVCGDAWITVPVSLDNNHATAESERDRRLNAALIRAEGFGAVMSLHKKRDAWDNWDTYCNPPAYKIKRRMSIQHKTTVDLDKVFAQLKNEFGVEIDFMEEDCRESLPATFEDEAHAAIDHSPDIDHWSFRSTVPKEEKKSTRPAVTFNEEYLDRIKKTVQKNLYEAILAGLVSSEPLLGDRCRCHIDPVLTPREKFDLHKDDVLREFHERFPGYDNVEVVWDDEDGKAVLGPFPLEYPTRLEGFLLRKDKETGIEWMWSTGLAYNEILSKQEKGKVAQKGTCETPTSSFIGKGDFKNLTMLSRRAEVWPFELYEAIEQIPGVTVEKMDVDFDEEKMHLVLDHPEKDSYDNDRYLSVDMCFSHVGETIRRNAPKWAWSAWNSGADLNGAVVLRQTPLSTTWDWAE